MAENSIALLPDIAEIPRLIEWVEGCCRDGAVAGDIVVKMTLALEEAVANVIQHGFDGQHGFDAAPASRRIEVQLDIADRCVTAVVIDNGRPFDPSTAPEPDLSLSLERRDPGGLGILLIHRMVDRIDYRRSGGCNRLRFEKMRG